MTFQMDTSNQSHNLTFQGKPQHNHNTVLKSVRQAYTGVDSRIMTSVDYGDLNDKENIDANRSNIQR